MSDLLMFSWRVPQGGQRPFHDATGNPGKQLPDASGSAAMIDLRGITKAYETAAGPFLALKGIDLQVHRGEFVAVVGKSGSGKSTLINMFTGIDHPTGGEVIVAKTRIRHARRRADGRVARPQSGHRLPVLPAPAHADRAGERHAAHGPGQMYDEDERSRAGACTCWSRWAWPTTPTSSPRPCPAGSSSARPSPAPWPTIRPSSSPTNRQATWTPRRPSRLRLFESLVAGGKTILMVTHDDELAARVPRTITLADGLIVDEVVR